MGSRETEMREIRTTGAIEVRIPAGPVGKDPDLVVPRSARGLVLFAHGSGSSRHSPRNQYVARRLQESEYATLLIDLLTPAEEQLDMERAHLRFDIPFLAGRLGAATRWTKGREGLSGLPLGYFGASTGAAAALVAAAEVGGVRAVVSRGGRPDLAGPVLTAVETPTLLIVGGADHEVLELNRRALEMLRCEKRLSVVRGASHLFQEPGALEQVANLAAGWFRGHLDSIEWEPSPQELSQPIRGE
jgi:dienelactone hydrolase